MKQGDIKQLGDHILICGSADDKELLKDIPKIRMMLTDPPYGVGYVEGKFKKDGKSQISVDREIQNDQLQSEENYETFTRGWLRASKEHLESYNSAYIFNSDLMVRALRNAMEKEGWYYSQTLIWVKSQVVVGRKDYLPQHELIVYGWHGRHKMERSKGKSVMFHPKPSRSRIHPTMKPVGLLRKLILDATKIGDVVYDPFGGSGSTLVACEQTKRRCVMVEIDPFYCKKIVERYEKLKTVDKRRAGLKQTS